MLGHICQCGGKDEVMDELEVVNILEQCYFNNIILQSWPNELIKEKILGSLFRQECNEKNIENLDI